MSIGKRIKELRTTQGLTQKQLAKMADISEISIRKYENEQRKPKLEVIEKLASIFDVQIDFILGKSDFKKFGSQIMLDDFKSLMELTEGKNKEISKDIINIADTMFLTIYNHSKDNDINYIKKIYSLYHNIWEISRLAESGFSLDDPTDNFPVDIEAKYKKLKEKHLEILDDVFNSLRCDEIED